MPGVDVNIYSYTFLFPRTTVDDDKKNIIRGETGT